MMREYHKIQSLFKRDEKGKIIDEFTLPEFWYLARNQWAGTEKIDGTNTRIHWDGEKITFGGRTDRAQIPAHLMNRLNEIVGAVDFKEIFPDAGDVTLYGEGYGKKIQKVGSLYNPDGVDFILFDVKIGRWWLKMEDVYLIAKKIGIKQVPVVFFGTLGDAIKKVSDGFPSMIGDVQAEGMVLTPTIPLLWRNGNRVITKLKTKDFT
jgi:ATP-dependent RNA circularization protein (DNA/RNA ligase family)